MAPNFAASDIPNLSGKVIVVTGGNIGLGRECILQLSKHSPSKIYMASRSEAKALSAISEIQEIVPNAPIVFVELDLASLASVKTAADEILATTNRLDILMNNAGIMTPPHNLTKDGYEIQFGTNHMGHALFTKLLLPLLSETAKKPNSDVRIVNLSSSEHTQAPNEGVIFDQVKTEMTSVGPRKLYGQSKLCNIYYTKALAKRYPQIKSVAVHPGVVQTNLISSFQEAHKFLAPLVTLLSKVAFTKVEDGALNQLWAATGKMDQVKQGGFYYPVAKEYDAAPIVNDPEMANKLWDFTEKELASHGY
ncbi:hypothetical protein ACHAQE_010837 [Botrytis cinerea]